MSFTTQIQLASDVAFQQRVQACADGQAAVFKDDARPDFVALAESVLRVEPKTLPTFFHLLAAAPGFADAADTGGGVDSSLITDAQILSATQAQWPTVAGLYFDDQGAPLP